MVTLLLNIGGEKKLMSQLTQSPYGYYGTGVIKMTDTDFNQKHLQ